jgi:ABC-2 type transport system ATP-binding protein
VYWRLTPWQNLRYFGHLKGRWGKELHIHAEQLLRELDLWERRNDPIRMFSRGMQQKVAIACALIADPPIVLLDEPTLGLDIQAAQTVKEWVYKLAREQNKTIVLTTHQLDLAQEVCDYVAIMRKGQLLTNLPLPELLHHFQQEYYQIRVKGVISEGQKGQFGALKIETENGETTLSGAIADQEQLQSILGSIHVLQFPLLSVERCEPDLEEVFLRLIEEKHILHDSKELVRSQG